MGYGYISVALFSFIFSGVQIGAIFPALGNNNKKGYIRHRAAPPPRRRPSSSGQRLAMASPISDQRVRVTAFFAERTLTGDTVPVNVDAVIYWMVWDPEKAALEVRQYERAVSFVAQTGLRDIIGKHELADLLQNRDKIGDDLQAILDQHTSPWGITCQNVGIKDIIIPADLENAMSKQAQAERERQARIILGTAETEISEKFAVASRVYQDNPIALQLRGMNMLFEGLKEKGSLIIVPSSALESMNMGAVGGLAALSKRA
jgi:hypothetical protein